jgi:hydrogenase-4 component F
VAFLVLLGGIFLAMSDTVVQVVFGTPPPDRARTPYRDTLATTAPLLLALALSLTMGLWLPASLTGMIRSAANQVEGQP